MNPSVLLPRELEFRLLALPLWTIAQGKLSRRLLFSDFKTAFAFMTEVAKIAEAMRHHPDWRNVWNSVEIELSTHDVGGITTLDFELAAAVEKIAAEFRAPENRS